MTKVRILYDFSTKKPTHTENSVSKQILIKISSKYVNRATLSTSSTHKIRPTQLQKTSNLSVQASIVDVVVQIYQAVCYIDIDICLWHATNTNSTQFLYPTKIAVFPVRKEKVTFSLQQLSLTVQWFNTVFVWWHFCAWEPIPVSSFLLLLTLGNYMLKSGNNNQEVSIKIVGIVFLQTCC